MMTGIFKVDFLSHNCYNKIMRKIPLDWLYALRQMFNIEYWNKPNTFEFIAFVVKAIIIIPGLLFDIQIWWLYLFALVSSSMIVWSSTKKTLPTLIWFNILWIFLAIAAIFKNLT